jgi:hypothetical protein
MHRSVCRAVVWAGVIGVLMSCGGCEGLGTGPSDMAPVSRLWYDKPADTQSGVQVGRFATTNATFGAREFRSCDVGTADDGVCPSLMVWMVSVAGTWCQLILYAPEGESLSVRNYSRAARLPAPGVAGIAFSCGRRACEMLDGSFTIHRLASNADQVITTLHTTFEQTCRVEGQPLATLAGEVWIVNGNRGAPPGFPSP